MSADLDIPPAADPVHARDAHATSRAFPVRPARPREHRDAFALLGHAFHDDPVATYLFPNAASRARRWARLSTLAAESMGHSALLLTTDGLEGTALWQTPLASELGAFRRLTITARFLALSRAGLTRANRLNALTSRNHPPGPHYYLAALGTDAARRRRGIGSALVRAGLDAADRDRLPAYLESSKATNVPFYQKHGFEVVTELEIEDDLVVWPMVRPPR